MNLEISQRRSSFSPLFAQIGDINKLYELARDRNPSARFELSNTVSTILESEITDRQAESVADVLIALLRQAERDIRQALAEKLSLLDNVPLRLILQLANDEIDIAAPVLSQSQVLSEFDLLYIIKSKNEEYWRVIAKRNDLQERVINELANTSDLQTAMNLTENNAIELTLQAMQSFSDIAKTSESLAAPLLRRPEMPKELAIGLYTYVGQEIKTFIADNYELDMQTVSDSVDEITIDFVDNKASTGFSPEPYMIDAARSFQEKEILNVGLMLTTLRRGHIRSFVAQFSEFTDLPIDVVGQILSQTNGQGLAVAAKAKGIIKQDFVSMFMLTSKIWNHSRMVEVTDIKKAIDYYNRTTPELAREILASKKSKVRR